MIEITSHRQGAILNRHHGTESAKSLKITVQGISESGHPVKVNGVPAQMDGRNFSAEVELTKKVNPVKASVMTPYGIYSQELELVWDKQSFRRFNCFIDDHSFVFTELTRQRPKHAFDHFYLAGLKKIHEETGFKLTLNTFYRNDHDKNGFLLKEMPDIWKSEFEANSDWLKISFHSYSEFPDRPYLESTAEEFGHDYDLVKNEIIRFAGEDTFIPPIVLHWGNIHPAVAAELIRRGSRCYGKGFRPRVMGGPSLAERQKGGDMEKVQNRSLSGEDKQAPTDGLRMHYGFQEETEYQEKYHAFYDPSLDFLFYRGTICCNLVPLAEIPKRFEAIMKDVEARGIDALSFASHEQYTFPSYPNYLPDHMERIALTARLYTENGFKPVFFNDGLLGNMSWEDRPE